jgi:hypothetical protein
VDIVLRKGRYLPLSPDQSVTPLMLALVGDMKFGPRCPSRLKELPLMTSGSSPARCAPHGIALSNFLDFQTIPGIEQVFENVPQCVDE